MQLDHDSMEAYLYLGLGCASGQWLPQGREGLCDMLASFTENSPTIKPRLGLFARHFGQVKREFENTKLKINDTN